jgi:hypothetical protein
MLYTSFGFNILLKINPNLVMYFVVSLFENLTDYLCLGCCFDYLSIELFRVWDFLVLQTGWVK